MQKHSWPADAIMVVASRKGQEVRCQMEAVVRTYCRHCGAALAADSATIRRAAAMDARHGRPIDFFCIECHALHRVEDCQIVEDHRPKARTT